MAMSLTYVINVGNEKIDYNEKGVMYAPSQAWLGVGEGMKGGDNGEEIRDGAGTY